MTLPRLGPFDVIEPIAAGGMGEVWRGVHRGAGVPVALKVVRREAEERAWLAALFRREIAGVARLDHPGIVLVLDHGEVGEDADAATGGRLPKGSPWLAMELASGGSLERARAATWREVRDVLHRLLDALAHAHARGILHRDVKPANVLWAGPQDLRPGLKLGDFGLAHAWDREDGEEGLPTSGTPAFMAPEQILGRPRAQGPWTDLYALGCLAWWMLTGHTPFERPDARAVLRAHLESPLPPFAPRMAVPPEVEPWLARMLARDARDRFRNAADAAWCLPAAGADTASPTIAAASGPLAAPTLVDLSDLDEPAPPEPAPAVAPAVASLPPMPATWRRDVQRVPIRLVGAGLGLYGLRAVPLVGRDRELDALWAALRRVRQDGRPAAVTLVGGAGTGATAIATRFGELAREAGAAEVVVATHDPVPGPRAGLAGMLARALRVGGLRPARALLAAEEALAGLDPWARDGLARLVSGEAAEAEDLAQLDVRLRLYAAWLAHVARERPVVVVLDDVPWGAEALALVRAVLARAGEAPFPVLFVATARDESLAARPVEAAALAAVEALEGVTKLRLGPLAPEDHRALVRELLALDDALVERVAARTQGSPLFAARLVGDWVRRELFEVGEAGFVLRPGAETPLPDDIHGLWQAHLVALGPSVAHALEVGAALGREVDEAEWRAACDEAGADVPPDLGARLAAARLAEPADGGWRFAHGMLRESVERAAAERGDWPAVNAACARMLARSEARPGRDERLGRHLAAAGEREASLAPLLAGAWEAWKTSRYEAALELVALREAVLDAIEAGRADRRRAEGALVRASALISLGRLDDVDRVASRLAETARRQRWDDVSAAARRYRGMAAVKRGDLAAARGFLDEALALARAAGDAHEEAAALQHLGTLARMRGEGRRSIEQLALARTLSAKLGDRQREAGSLRELAGTEVTFGDPARGAEAAREAAELYRAIGSTTGLAACHNALGEALRRQGDRPGAEAAFRDCLALVDRAGSQARAFPRLNLGLLLVERGAWEEAHALLLEARAMLAADRRRALVGYTDALRLPCLAGLRRWTELDACLAAASEALLETGLVEPDIARMALLAARLADERGQAARARAVRALADDQDDARPDTSET